MKRPVLLACLLMSSISWVRAQQIASSLPPNTYHWGEHIAKVEIDSISDHIGDTVKISGKILGYSVLDDRTMVFFGAPYPNQKLTVVLKAGAKGYLSAQIQMQGHRESGAKYLKDKKLSAIGVVTLYNGKPEIDITEPDKFIVEP